MVRKHSQESLLDAFKEALVKAFDEVENNNSRKLRSTAAKKSRNTALKKSENTVKLNFPDSIEVTDEDGYTQTIPLSRQTTMGELEKIMDEIEEGVDSSVVNKRAEDMLSLMLETYPYDNIHRLIKQMKALSEKESKIKQICELSVSDRGVIYFYRPDGKKVNCNFERGRLGRVLYILFLRQIERSVKDPCIPPSICRERLKKYKNELLAIYKEMCYSRTDDEMRISIEMLWRDPGNEISHINSFFNRLFDNESLEGKHYYIKEVGKNDDGEELYAVGLEAKDFKLGKYSIHKLTV